MTDYRDTLREANAARQALWVADPAATDIDWRLNELAGEAGEVCNVLKKLHRERLGIPGSRDTTAHLAEELADVVICLDLFCMTAGLPHLDFPTRPFVSNSLIPLTARGRDLTIAVGILCQGTSREDQQFDRAQTVLSCVRALAMAERINLRAAVSGKFNSTSEKMGFAVRLAPGWTDLSY